MADESNIDLERGEQVARALFGDARFEQSRRNAPENERRSLLRLADELIFGRTYTRPHLELQQRSLCTIAALTVLSQPVQLRVHIAGALNIGVPFESIVEVIHQMAFYGGFPVALNAMEIAVDCHRAAQENSGPIT